MIKVGLIYDLDHGNIKGDSELVHGDEQKTITRKSIAQILKEKYQVIEIPADENILSKLKQSKIDMALNLSTGVRGESRQSQIPAILEMEGIPYIGSGILSHGLALNKAMAKIIFEYNKIPTPKFQIFNNHLEKLDPNLSFPLIVKPACEGSGFGIYKDSVVHNQSQLRKKVEFLLSKYQPPVLVEEFIEGREFTVGILGNGQDKRVLPIMEINFDDVPEEFGKFYTFEVKTKLDDKTKYFCPAPISKELEHKIKEAASKAFDSLGCRDISRVDVRVRDNQPYIIEINSLPGLKPTYSDLPKMALKAGLEYRQLIFLLLEGAIKRIKKLPEDIAN